jgi:PleD family two-component response regulator
VTASFGVTLLDADVPIEESITRADQALYRAKAAGRNQAMLWDPSMA